VLVRAAAARAITNGKEHALAAGDSLLLDRADEPRIEIAPAGAAQLYVVELWRL
jgi:hypothetical protein